MNAAAFSPTTLIALLHGPDQVGLVARVSGWIFQRGGNILHADQHRDMEAGVFFQRVEWQPAAEADVSAEAAEFRAFGESLGMHTRVARGDLRPRVVVFVSKFDHCFHDLMLRWKSGDYAADFVAVVSNHPDLAEAARGYGLPYHHIPVTPVTKPEAEARQLALLRELRADLVVMARYMQVLTEDFLRQSPPVINIHHSFLPAFAGGRPYHQAYERGVKLIGATAHYATAVLDDGPIIEQNVVRVTHRHGVSDLIRMGRDLERLVLAEAVRAHLQNRVLVYGKRTVVFA